MHNRNPKTVFLKLYDDFVLFRDLKSGTAGKLYDNIPTMEAIWRNDLWTALAVVSKVRLEKGYKEWGEKRKNGSTTMLSFLSCVRIGAIRCKETRRWKNCCNSHITGSWKAAAGLRREKISSAELHLYLKACFGFRKQIFKKDLTAFLFMRMIMYHNMMM
jgi:hypothetical protein